MRRASVPTLSDSGEAGQRRMKHLFGSFLWVFVLWPYFFSSDQHLARGEDDSGYTLTFVARPATITGFGPTSLTGHAYVILGTKTRTGLKEDVYAFYPKSDSLKGVIKGPGMLIGEYNCVQGWDPCADPKFAKKIRENLSGAADVTVSETIPITQEQRGKVFTTIKKWNEKNYNLEDSNCVHFLEEVMAVTDYPAPPVTGLDRIPTRYVRAIQEAKVKEDRRRAEEATKVAKEGQATAERKQREAENERDRAKESERLAKEEAERAKEGARRADEETRRRVEAESIPSGWIQCSCPDKHSAMGKVVHGARWHPDGQSCP